MGRDCQLRKGREGEKHSVESIFVWRREIFKYELSEFSNNNSSLVDAQWNNDILFEMFGFIAKGYCQRDLESLTLRWQQHWDLIGPQSGMNNEAIWLADGKFQIVKWDQHWHLGHNLGVFFYFDSPVKIGILGGNLNWMK